MAPKDVAPLIDMLKSLAEAERQEAMGYAINAFDLNDTLGHLNDGSYAPFVEACRLLSDLMTARQPEPPAAPLVRVDNLEVFVDDDGAVYLGVKP